jgi:8-oxo-dGTP pyrophosphatase MutT (NUDIX family)
MNRFPELLKAELQKPLPGIEVQLQMAPPDRSLKDFPRVPLEDASIAAVLIILYQHNDSVYTVFIQRPDYEGVHSGQISFPGGRREMKDTDIIKTALREANEEVGVDLFRISVIGTLTPLFIPVSKTIVTPVVGWTNNRPEFKIQEDEVVYLIEGDLKKFLNPSIIKIERFEIRGEMRDIKYFDYDGHVIWGATAMILNELLTIISKSNISFKG